MNIIVGFVSVLALLIGLPVCAAEAPAGASASAGEHAGHAGMMDHAGMAGVMEMAGKDRPKAWTGYPMLNVRMGGRGGHEQAATTATPQNLVADSIDAYSNDVTDAAMHRQLPLGMAGAKLDQPAAGGFHWLAARAETGDRVVVASTVYYFSHPGKNPTAMFLQPKHELEIIPQPFPREHSRYRADEDWRFLVHFNGQPLPNQKVALETRNGTRAELVSDGKGVVTVHLPQDFKPETGQEATEGRRGRRSAEFVLATEYVADGKTYLTGFNSSYSPDAFDQRSLALGLGFTLIGGLCAVPLLRHRRSAPVPAAGTDTSKGA